MGAGRAAQTSVQTTFNQGTTDCELRELLLKVGRSSCRFQRVPIQAARRELPGAQP